MPIFGRNTIVGSDTTLPGGTGRVFMSRYELTEAGTLNHVGIYSLATGGGLVRGVVYADNGGQPGALVAVGAPVAVVANSWVQSAMVGQTLPPGLYWIGAITQDFLSSLYADDIGGISWAQWGDANFNSPPNPWTGGGSATYLVSAYADYSVGSGPAEDNKANSTLTADDAVATSTVILVNVAHAVLQAENATASAGGAGTNRAQAFLQAEDAGVAASVSITNRMSAYLVAEDAGVAATGLLVNVAIASLQAADAVSEGGQGQGNVATAVLVAADATVVVTAIVGNIAHAKIVAADATVYARAGGGDQPSITIKVPARVRALRVGQRINRITVK